MLELWVYAGYHIKQIDPVRLEQSEPDLRASAEHCVPKAKYHNRNFKEVQQRVFAQDPRSC
jgi:hypothetical protein